MHQLLIEGGNIWPDVETRFDPKIIEPLTQATQKYLNKLGTEAHTTGSGYKPRVDREGNPIPPNDLDVLIDLETVMAKLKAPDAKAARKALSQYFQEQGIETKQSGVTVHARIPLGNKFYQVDIKPIMYAAEIAAHHRHDIPPGSPYKGVNKQMMMNALATSQGLLWSPDEGLYRRDPAGKKAELLARGDMGKIAKFLLGPRADAASLGSVESIMAAIPDERRRQEIYDIAKSSPSWQAATPTVTEWFRRAMDLLK